MNTLIVYIDINIRQINLGSVIAIFEEIFKKGGNKFLIYLNKKSFTKWVQSFYGNRNNQDYYKNIVNESMYPIIHSQHSIIIDKKYKTSKDKKGFNEESDAYDQHFYNNKLKDNSGNVKLIEFLGHYFDD